MRTESIQKSKIIRFRVSEEEQQQLKRAAKRKGMTISEYMRYIVKKSQKGA